MTCSNCSLWGHVEQRFTKKNVAGQQGTETQQGVESIVAPIETQGGFIHPSPTKGLVDPKVAYEGSAGKVNVEPATEKGISQEVISEIVAGSKQLIEATNEVEHEIMK